MPQVVSRGLHRPKQEAGRRVDVNHPHDGFEICENCYGLGQNLIQ